MHWMLGLKEKPSGERPRAQAPTTSRPVDGFAKIANSTCCSRGLSLSSNTKGS